MEQDTRYDAPTILIIGTLDTKGAEIQWIARSLDELGCGVLILDSGVAGTPSYEGAAYSREEVAAAGGTDLRELARLPRGEAVAMMAEGVKSIAVRLAAENRIHGALCIGGAGVSLASSAFQELPLGFPKLIVTPLASGSRQFDAFIGTKDIAVLHSVVDIMGVNGITEPVFRQAAGYIAGAAKAAFKDGRVFTARADAAQRMVAATMNGNTTPALMQARDMLQAHGFELVTFHANGVGGKAMEDMLRSGLFWGVLDYTTTELAGYEIGGLMSAGPRRMEAAGELGVPQVLVPGCLDFITTGPYGETAATYTGRPLYPHNPQFTLVRLTREEMISLAHSFARKASASLGPTAVCIPLRGFSIPDHEGGPFWDPDADGAFINTLRDQISPNVTLELIDAHINDTAFVERAVSLLLEVLEVAANRRDEVAMNP